MNDPREAVDAIETAIHYMGYDEIAVGYGLATFPHRTLQQKFMRIVINFIEKEAANYESGEYDDRNMATCRLCHQLLKKIEEIPVNEQVLPVI